MNDIIEKMLTNKMKFSIDVIIKKETGGGYYAHSNQLKGVSAGGGTLKETIGNYTDLALFHLMHLITNNRKIPAGILKKPKKYILKPKTIGSLFVKTQTINPVLQLQFA